MIKFENISNIREIDFLLKPEFYFTELYSSFSIYFWV